MISWIKDYIGIKNFIVFILGIIIILGFLKGPSVYRMIAGNQYDCTITATVTNIAAQETSSQSYNGTNTRITGYDITYTYKAGNETRSKTEFIEPGSESRFLSDQFNSGRPCFIEIRYSGKSPSETMISKLILKR
jgi:hypothetical protein